MKEFYGKTFSPDDIVNKLFDLYKQATVERSHYYVGSIVMEAIDEILRLREKNGQSC